MNERGYNDPQMGSPSNQRADTTSYSGDRDTPDIRYDPPTDSGRCPKEKRWKLKVAVKTPLCHTKTNLKAVNVQRGSWVN